MQDTIIQRWRDPADGTICYIYLPISAQHSPPTQAGFVQYGDTQLRGIPDFQGFSFAEPFLTATAVDCGDGDDADLD